jgi:hypothetical protein
VRETISQHEVNVGKVPRKYLQVTYVTHDLCSSLQRFRTLHTRVYPKVSGLAARSENCKWYSSLPLGVVGSLFCESV